MLHDPQANATRLLIRTGVQADRIGRLTAALRDYQAQAGGGQRHRRCSKTDRLRLPGELRIVSVAVHRRSHREEANGGA